MSQNLVDTMPLDEVLDMANSGQSLDTAGIPLEEMQEQPVEEVIGDE